MLRCPFNVAKHLSSALRDDLDDNASVHKRADYIIGSLPDSIDPFMLAFYCYFEPVLVKVDST